MTELHSLPLRLGYLDVADSKQLCEVASLRLEAVQALIGLLLRENPPEYVRLPCHTLSSAQALLTEVDALYRRAFAMMLRKGRV